MKRARVRKTYCWIVVCGVFLSASLVLGQNGDTGPIPDDGATTCTNGAGNGRCGGGGDKECPCNELNKGGKSECRSNSPAGVTLGYGEAFAMLDDDGPSATPGVVTCSSCGSIGTAIPEASQLPRVRLQRIWHSINYEGSFGSGMFMTYDYEIVRFVSDGTTYIHFTDPNHIGDAGGSLETFREFGKGFVAVEWFGRAFLHTRVVIDPSDPQHITFVQLDGRRFGFEWTNYIQNGHYERARLEYIEDRNGNRISFQYLRPATENTRDALKWTTATDSYGRTLTFNYIVWEGRNVISEVALPGGRKIRYLYDAAINPYFFHKVDYGNGIESEWLHEPTTHTYTRNEAQLSADHFRQAIRLSKSPNGRTRSVTRADGTFELVRSQKESNGLFITTLYDRGETFVATSKATRSIMSERQLRLDGTFEEQTVFDTKDNRPWATKVTKPDGRIWSGERDEGNDRITSMTYPDDRGGNSTESFTYNNFAQMTSKTHRSGAIETWTYDGAGNMLEHTEAAGVSGVTATEMWTYNGRGQVLTQTDFNGNLTSYDYYANGDLKKITLPAGPGQPGGAINYAHDAAGRIASITDPLSRTVSYEYDSGGRLTEATYGDGSTEEMVYGTGIFSARLLSKKDRNGNLTVYAYDRAGRVFTEQVQQVGTGSLLSTLTNTWDASTGRLMAVDRDGDSTGFSYDYKGRILTTTVHPRAGRNLVTTNVYDQFHLLSTTDPYGRETSYTYDLLDRVLCTSVELAPGGAAITNCNEYDQQGRNTAFVDGNGIRHEYAYDERDRRVLERSAAGTPAEAIEKYTYDGNNNLTIKTDKNDHLWRRTYTARDSILSDANPLNQTTTYTYYPDGLVETMTNPNNHTTRYVYDLCCGLESGGRLVELIDADLKVKRFEYDSNGNRTKVTDESGRVSSYEYDGLNRLIGTSVDPSGLNLQTVIGYDQTPGVVGRTETTTNPAGQVVSKGYDGANRLSSVTGETPHLSYTYDVQDESTGFLVKTTITDANNNSRSSLVDGAGRTIKTFDGLNHATEMSYDSNSNLLLVIDRDLRRTKYDYDERNRRTKMTSDAGSGGINATTQYQYDAVGNLLGLTDAEGKVTKYAYDDADRRLTATYAFGTADARQWSYTYHPLGQLRQITKPNDILIDFTYDKPERLATRTYRRKSPTPKMQMLSVDTFTYHANGLLKAAVGGLDNTTIDRANLAADYDGANRLVQERQNIGAGPKSVTYTYHPDDLVNQITYPGGATVQHDYTDRRELKDVKINGGMQAHHTYDPGGRRESRSYANGKVTKWEYDKDDRITSLNHLGVQAWNYRYTNEDDALVQDDQTTSDMGEAYAYDGMHRLVDYKRGQVAGNTVPTPPPVAFLQGWTLDKVGNWTAWNNNGTNETRTHSNHHALKTRSTAPLPMEYDGDLNQTFDGVAGFKLVYDANDRLKQVIQPTPGRLVCIAEYRYDALGRRVEKLITGSPNTVVRYYYSGDRIIEERNGSDAVTATYTYGHYIDEPLTMDRDLNNNAAFEANERFYYHSNRMYSTYALTNAVGNIVERYAYTPYGQATTFDAAYANPDIASRLGNPYTFTGRELDAETGLMHYRARTYDTVQGRFKQRDPIGYRDGMNLYDYVRNNPVNEVDPGGLARGNWWDPRTYLGVPPRPGGFTGVGAGFFRGLGGEGGLELVRLDECWCQYYIYFGLGGGVGQFGVSANFGSVMNVDNPRDYEGYFATVSAGIPGFGGGFSATPNLNSIPGIGDYFAPPDSLSASQGAGPQTGAGFSTSLRHYWAVGDKFRCE